MTAYKNRSSVQIEQVKKFERDEVREALLTLSTHTGTHVDAPAHFIKTGSTTDQVALTSTIGPCVVIDMTHCIDAINRDDLVAVDDQLSRDIIVLCKTRNSRRAATETFDPLFVYLTADAAAYLVERMVRAVGIDYLGIERNQSGHETHIQLLSAGIGIIEGLRLEHVNSGSYFLWCLPLLIVGADGAPARAVLVPHQ